MNRMLKAILVITLASVLTMGLVINGCSGESEQDSVALGRITGVSTDSSQSPQTGQLAPDFHFETPEGQSTSLSQLKGMPVLVNFWATWCSPCAYEMPFIQQVYEDWTGEELVMLAINIGESPSQVEEFMQSQGLSFTVLLDSETTVAQRYNIQYIPSTFFIDEYSFIQEIKIGAFQSKAEIENSLSKLTMTQ